jgi:hypothetical protein
MVAKKGVVILDDKEVGSSIEKALNKALKENKLSYSDLESSSYSLKKYIYVNNEVQYCNIPVDLTDELLKAVAKDKNSEAKKLMNKSSRYSYSGMAYYSSGNSEYIQNSDELFEFALECAGEEFDETKSYVVINMTINGEEISVFTNNIKEFKKIRKTS